MQSFHELRGKVFWSGGVVGGAVAVTVTPLILSDWVCLITQQLLRKVKDRMMS